MKKQSKEEKLIAQRMAVNETIAKMRRFDAELEQKRKLFTDKALKAHLMGASAQEQSAKIALKQVIAQQRLAQRMLLNFEITVGMKDVSLLSADFMKQMSDMTKQMGKIVSSADLGNMEKEFAEALAKAQMHSEKMNELLESMSVMSESGITGEIGITDEEVDAIVDRAAAVSEQDLDRDIERSARKIAVKEIKQEG